MSDCEEECPECPAGLPAWLATFADLMSLLMCFFVLLLSFSEMDVMKYKQVAGSMSDAFGVQNTIKTKDIPKGTSIIAQEFSPGKPEPTPIAEVKQSTTDVTQAELQVSCPKGKAPEDLKSSEAAEAAQTLAAQTLAQQKTEESAAAVAAALSREIKNGQVEVETDGTKIVIRVKEHGSFASGSATMRPGFIPIMARIRDVLRGISGLYTIEGHTDNVPIKTARFRSNWELSSSRAVSVAHELMLGGYLEEARFTIVGYGSIRPIVPNSTVDNRSKNRRVEIIIEQGKSPDWEEFQVLDSKEVQGLKDDLRSDGEPVTFDFDQDEIF